jgi:hypothetical protein
VEGLVVEAVAELVAVLPGVHQGVLQAVADPGVLLLLVVPVGLAVRVVRQQDLLDRKDRHLVLTGLVVVRVPALAFWGDPVWAGFSGLLSVGTAGGAVVTVGQT